MELQQKHSKLDSLNYSRLEMQGFNQGMGFNNCQVTKINVQIQGQYSDLFKQNIPKNLVKTLQQIDDLRKENIETWKLKTENQGLPPKEANHTN